MKVVLQWVPGQVGVVKNGWADGVANEARRSYQGKLGWSKIALGLFGVR